MDSSLDLTPHSRPAPAPGDDRLCHFPWPKLPHSPGRPRWTGHGFRIGSRECGVLDYHPATRGLFESTAGSSGSPIQAPSPVDRASQRTCLNLLKRHVQEPTTILEIGYGRDSLLPQLREHFPASSLIGAGSLLAPLDGMAQNAPGIPLLAFDLLTCPLPDACVDAVVMRSVLERIGDDRAAMHQINRILRPGGICIVEVPAGPHLYDDYDEHLRHFRRYTPGHLHDLVCEAGFNPLGGSHLGFFAYPGFWLSKRRSQREAVRKPEGVANRIRRNAEAWQNPILDMAMGLEVRLGRWISFPLGIHCVLACRRPALPAVYIRDTQSRLESSKFAGVRQPSTRDFR